jgi:ATP synthase protein I
LSAIDSAPNFLDGFITMRRRAPGHDRTRMPDKSDPPDDERALRVRLDALSGKLKAQRPEAAASPRANSPKPPDNLASGMSMGLRAGSEFVAAILVGGAIGWGLDWALKTKPAFTIVFFLLGVAAGVWNVIRATSPKREPPAT